ncbi:MAG: peptide deformylase [Candidatus Zixiibacteriota bacterium]|nr:MAG: peptide deformylase [candidate division Zixibacteria bacterium]
MAERPIVIYGDPVLREVSAPINAIDHEVKALVSDMVDTLKAAQGLGLAAVQVGVPVRLFIVDFSAIDIADSLKVFINPKILETSDETVEMEEGCLSFPGIYEKIVRPAEVRVQATELDGTRFELSLSGLAARAVLHEYDHIEGKLFIDRMSSITRALLKGKLKKLAQAS